MIILVLENIRSVYNVGSIFRTMEGFGFEKAFLVGITPTPLDKKGEKRKDFHKTALGAEDRITWEYFESTEALLEAYKNCDIICLEKTEGSIPLWEEKFEETKEKNILLVLGSETEGVSKTFLEKAKSIVEIPMKGEKESYNVSVAAGMLLYEIRRKEK